MQRGINLQEILSTFLAIRRLYFTVDPRVSIFHNLLLDRLFIYHVMWKFLFLFFFFFKVKILIWKFNHYVIRLLRVYDKNYYLIYKIFHFLEQKVYIVFFLLSINIIMHNILKINDIVKHLIFFIQWHKKFS